MCRYHFSVMVAVSILHGIAHCNDVRSESVNRTGASPQSKVISDSFPFPDNFRSIREQDVRIVGRDAKVASCEKLLQDNLDHPERASVMVEIANLWQISIPGSGIEPDPAKVDEWVRKARDTAKKGSRIWFDVSFRLFYAVFRKTPDAAETILNEVNENSTGPGIDAWTLYHRQILACRRGDLVEAERICRQLQAWDLSPRNRPKDMADVTKIIDSMQLSARQLLMFFTQLREPTVDRQRRIERFCEDYSGSMYIQEFEEHALDHLRSLPVVTADGLIGENAP